MTELGNIMNGTTLRLRTNLSSSHVEIRRSGVGLTLGGFAISAEFRVVDAKPSTYSGLALPRVLIIALGSDPPIHFAVPIDELGLFSVIG